VAHADTVLRAPRGASTEDGEPELDPEEQFFEAEPSEWGIVTEDPSADAPAGVAVARAPAAVGAPGDGVRRGLALGDRTVGVRAALVRPALRARVT